ncbi:MAG TPA: N-acetylmuramoyl-L-alanine amidase [Bacteroidia bacterium]|nr:N-acetylmuramoyl-L-alanine amidase [Bacteroidia bacterium]
MRKINYLVVHCTAGNPKETIPQLINGFKARGWKNNGYHIVVDGAGQRHDITPLENIANGVAGHNANSIHVSYMGGIDKLGKPMDTRTEAQKRQLLLILKELKAKFPLANILGHRDLSPDTNHNGKVDSFEWVKVCPCFEAIKEYSSL